MIPSKTGKKPTTNQKNLQQTKKVHCELPLLCKMFHKFLARMTTTTMASKGEIQDFILGTTARLSICHLDSRRFIHTVWSSHRQMPLFTFWNFSSSFSYLENCVSLSSHFKNILSSPQLCVPIQGGDWRHFTGYYLVCICRSQNQRAQSFSFFS